MYKMIMRLAIFEILFVSSLLLPIDAFCQTASVLTNELPLEKIYIHTDRSSYMAGDTIWFKGYLWYGADQKPDTTSKVLYVNLYGPDGEKSQSKKLLIENGTAQGDFILGENNLAGDYVLMGYTQLITDYGNGVPFSRLLTVNSPEHSLVIDFEPVVINNAGYDSLQVNYRLYDMTGDGSLLGRTRNVTYSLNVSGEVITEGSTNIFSGNEQQFKSSLSGMAENDSIAVFELTVDLNDTLITREIKIPLKETIELQFFPEGGTLINGQQSKLAFKAIGVDGFSREVNGIIVDNEDKLVSGFNTTHKGMGSFVFTPEEGKLYTARFEYNEKPYTVALPIATNAGSSINLSFDKNGTDPLLSISSTDQNPNNQKYIAATSFGELRFIESVQLDEGKLEAELSTEKFPEGITRLTLLNEDYQAECERLFYVDKGERFRVEITADSTAYNSRSKVCLMLRVTDMDGNPVQTNLSLSAVDMDQMGGGTTTDISNYKLLISELNGYVEEPGYYFQNGKIMDYQSLDLLMLTQGYRSFDEKVIGEETIELIADPDFYVSGRIEPYNKSKKMDYSELILMLINTSGESTYFETVPDSTGSFSFTLPIQYGDANCLLQVLNKRGNPFRGYIYLDESKEPLNTEIDQILVSQRVGTVQRVDFVRQLQAVKKAEYEHELEDIAMSYVLEEVDITVRDKKWFRRYEENADLIADMDTLDPDADKYDNLHDLLVKEFEAKERIQYGFNLKTVLLPSKGDAFEYIPLYVVNGTAYWDGNDPNVLSILSMMETFDVKNIKKIMVIPPGDLSYHYLDSGLKGFSNTIPSLVFIETYDDTYRGDPKGIETLVINGLDSPREFYSPNYEVADTEDLAYDFRATLFWEPELITDANGMATVKFFKSDTPTGMVVEVNGVETVSGNPGYGILEISTESVNKGSLSADY